MARFLDAFEQINGMQRKQVVDAGVGYLQRGESVYLAPEGQLSKTFELGRFYPGFARMYRRCPVPIIPIALLAPRRHMRDISRLAKHLNGEEFRLVCVFRGLFCVSVGAPLLPELPEGDADHQDQCLVDLLRTRIAELTEDMRVNLFWTQ